MYRLGESVFLSYALRLSQLAQHLTNIGVQQNGLLFQPSHGESLAQIDAGVSCLGILRRHTQERHLDDAGGVAAHAQLQKQDAAVSIPMQEILIPPGRGIPARILHKPIVTAQVRGLWGRKSSKCNTGGKDLRRRKPIEAFSGTAIDEMLNALNISI